MWLCSVPILWMENTQWIYYTKIANMFSFCVSNYGNLSNKNDKEKWDIFSGLVLY